MWNEEWSALPIVNEELRGKECGMWNEEGEKRMKRETWKTIIQVVISILTAALTAMGTTSCINGFMH